MQLISKSHASLNPRLTIEEIISSAARYHGHIRASETQDFATKLLEQVGLRSEHLKRFPRFSGGQRQRISIARALALRPEIVLCDEAVSSWTSRFRHKSSILLELQQQQGLSYLFISHDLAVIQHLADRVAVMYLGRIVRSPTVRNSSKPLPIPTHKLFCGRFPLEPKDSTPSGDRVLLGMSQSYQAAYWLRFCRTLSTSDQRCRQQRPEFRQIRTGQLVACHHARMDSA